MDMLLEEEEEEGWRGGGGEVREVRVEEEGAGGEEGKGIKMVKHVTWSYQ